MKILTDTQEQLLETASKYCGPNNPIKYDTLQQLCGCKSFAGTFNFLLKKGYFQPYPTGDYSNQYTRTVKQYTK